MAQLAVQVAQPLVMETLCAFLRRLGYTEAPVAQADLVLTDGTGEGLPPGIPQLVLNFPVRLAEIAPRITRLLAVGHTQAMAHGWRLQREARELQHPQHGSIALTDKETALLVQLLAARGAVVLREALLAEVWGAEEMETHTLETHIYRLRQKLEAVSMPPAAIMAEEAGYRLDVT
jgi:DNA-binding response OmpR family regulator